ncbi:hypothetical protein E4T39_07968 [Aureobasidium subglaciale]|nr:hypothetical protein E4T39_07968 [Aureobasidium subglaciale]
MFHHPIATKIATRKEDWRINPKTSILKQFLMINTKDSEATLQLAFHVSSHMSSPSKFERFNTRTTNTTDIFDLVMAYFDIYEDNTISPAPSAAMNDTDPTVHSLQSGPPSAEVHQSESTRKEQDVDFESQEHKDSLERDLVVVASLENGNRQLIEQGFTDQSNVDLGKTTLQGDPANKFWKRWSGYQTLKGMLYGSPNIKANEESKVQKSMPPQAAQQLTGHIVVEKSHNAHVQEPLTTRDTSCNDLEERTHHHWLSSHGFQALHMKLSHGSPSKTQDDSRKDSLHQEDTVEGQGGQYTPNRRMSVRALVGRRNSVGQGQDPKA